MNLFTAHNQWSTRPADQRFWTLDEMLDATTSYRESAIEKPADYRDLRVEAVDGDIQLLGRQGVPARLTNWAFGQLAQRVGAPAGYLRELPATLAAQNLNYGLREAGEGTAQLLFHRNGSHVLRAMTGNVYRRVWNCDLIGQLMNTLPQGWQVPPARKPAIAGIPTRKATAQDVLRVSQQNSSLAVREGDEIAPAGLYASDHDMFIFMVNEQAGINDGTGHQLGRGFFLSNSEVGAGSIAITTFLYDAICGNHIVWGSKEVRELRIRHTGQDIDGRVFDGVKVQLTEYANSSKSELEGKIKRARELVLGVDKMEVVKALFARANLTKKVLEQAFDAAEQSPRYGAPTSLWGMVNGLTEVSQRTGHADTRMAIDREAGQLMDGNF